MPDFTSVLRADSAAQPQQASSAPDFTGVLRAQPMTDYSQWQPVPNSQIKKDPIKVESSGGGADFGALVKAGLVDDPRIKAKIFAEARGISEQEIPNYYKITPDGAILFKGEDGVFRPEDSNSLFSGQGVKELGASFVSNGPGVVLSTIGGIGGGTAGSVLPGAGTAAGAISGAALGAAGGEGYRKLMGNLLFDEQQTPTGNIQSMLTEGAYGAAGEAGGLLVGKGVNAFRTRRAVRDIARLDRAASARLEQLSKQQGITLTPGEQTGLQSLITDQWLLSTLPQSSDTIGSFLKRRESDIQQGVFRYFAMLSDAKSPYQAAQRGMGGVQNYRKALIDKRSAAVRDQYKAAFSTTPEVDPAPLIENLKARLPNANSQQRATIRSIMKDVAPDDEGMLPPLEKLHNAKLAIDSKLEKLQNPQTALANYDKRILTEAKESLLELMEEASPEYRAARTTFQDLSKPINQLDESIAGGFVNKDALEATGVVKRIFSENSSPEAIMEARKIIGTADPGGWNAIVRSHLESKFNALKDLQVNAPQNIGGQFRKAVYGSVRDRQMLKAAMTPQQLSALDDLMTVLEATSRGFKGNSITVPAGEALKQMKEEAVREGSAAVRAPLAIMNIPRLPAKAKELYMEFRLGKHADKMAKIITSPDAMRQLKAHTLKVREARPGTEKFLGALGSALGVVLGDSGSTSSESSPDQQ